MYKIPVKFGKINNLTDARFAAAAAAEIIGFCFDKQSPHLITLEKAKEILGWIEGPQYTGEFHGQSWEEINETAKFLGLHFVQVIPGFSIQEIQMFESRVILQLDLNLRTENETEKVLSDFSDVVTYFQISSGIDQKYNAEFLKNICRKYPVIWDLNTSPENIAEILNDIKPAMINLSGTAESKTGVKDFDQVQEILDLLLV